MDRPPSIVTFERCYLGGLVVSAINTATTWSQFQMTPQVARANAVIGAWYLPTITALGFALPLILWYFIARRGSTVAKWVMVVCTAIGVLGLAFAVTMGSYVSALSGLLTAAAVLLNVVAATMLFRPDAQVWFGELPDEDRS